MHAVLKNAIHRPIRSGRMVKRAVLWHGRCFMGLNPQQCLWIHDGPSTCIKKVWMPCWLPRRQQVSHQRWIWGIHCLQATSTQARNRAWLWCLGRTSAEVQDMGISGPTKKTCKGSFKVERNWWFVETPGSQTTLEVDSRDIVPPKKFDF